MSEEASKKKKSLVQRVSTALPLVAVLVLVLCVGKWAMAAALLLCITLSIHEELSALKAGGHRPVGWPAYAALFASAALLFWSDLSVMPILTVFTLAVLLCVMCRREPELMDVLVSILPLFTLVLPAACAFALLAMEPRCFHMYLVFLVLAVPILGDTFAYFVGSSLGGPKLCPQISPNKTISGAVGGLIGSVLSALLVGIGFKLACPDFAGFPPFWADMAVGLIAGLAGQLGDLFASMVKRHCRIKDFSHIFPGHGGMLDRMDSIVFAMIVIYCYAAMIPPAM